MKAVLVYLAGDEMPTRIYPYYNDDWKKAATLKAQAFCAGQPHWCDRKIEFGSVSIRRPVRKDNSAQVATALKRMKARAEAFLNKKGGKK